MNRSTAPPPKLPPTWFKHAFWRVHRGWDQGQPAWWRNLEAHPDAVVRLAHEKPRPVRACQAAGEERGRLWSRWAEIDDGLDTFAQRRSTVTPVVVFEPRGAAA